MVDTIYVSLDPANQKTLIQPITHIVDYYKLTLKKNQLKIYIDKIISIIIKSILI